MRTMAELQAEREEAIEGYEIDAHGVIRSPGKFEAEMCYVPYFWENDPDPLDWPEGDTSYVTLIGPEDARMWPELANVAALHMQESEQGFVSCETLTLQEYHALNARNDAAWEEHDLDEDEC